MRHWICVALAAGLASPAFAQSAPTTGDLPSAADLANRDSFTLGVGGAIVPDYEGSDDYHFIPAAAVRGQYRGISFVTRGLYLYVDVVPQGTGIDLDAGPVIGARFNKRRHIKDDIVELLPRTKTAIEAGGFVGISMHGLTNPYDKLSLRLDVLHDIGSAHKSTVFSPNVEFSTPLSTTTYASANVGLEFVGNKYANYYYTVTPAESVLTGGALPAFNAGGGLKNWKAGLLLNQSISGDLLHGFSIFGAAQYSRLVGDFKRAPIVSIRGSASQWLGAAGIAYSW